MSVIIGLVQDGKVYLGVDTQTTSGGMAIKNLNKNNIKVWKVNGIDHCIMAHAGRCRDASIVRTMDDLVSDYDDYKGYVDYDFVVNCVVPHIVDELKDVGYIKCDGNYIDTIPSSFLFAYKDSLYEITKDLTVIEVGSYIARGSGAYLAVGSLSTTEGLDPYERIKRALDAASESDIYVGKPYIVCDTMDGEFRIVEGE